MIKLSRHVLNERVGAFVSVNNGTVKGCVADISFFAKNGAGFAYENNAEISNSVSLRCVREKQSKGFYVRNSGSVSESGYIASRKAHKTGHNGAEEYIFGNAELCIDADTPTEEICRKLELDGVRQSAVLSGGSLFPDISADMYAVSGEGDDELICIETAEDLKNMIEAVNSGDRNAAGAHYVLTNDINMKGARLAPIGISENCSFFGKFDGNGKTVSNFTIDCRGNEYGGFFGYTQNAEVANLVIDCILKGNGGGTVGGMAGCVAGGVFANCQVNVARYVLGRFLR